MIKFTEKILIQNNAQVIFDYTQDYDNRLSWDSFLKKATLINGATKAGKGVRAWCVAHNGLGMETEYVSFNPPRGTAIKMTRGPFLFKSFLGSWTFKALQDDQTEVIFLYSYELRFPFTLLSFFIRRNLQSNVRQRLVDLKRCVEKSVSQRH